MADETLAFSVKIDGVDRAINSFKDLKQAKKDATEAFLRGDKDAAKALADLKDKTEDLTDATQTLKGSGIEKINSSFSQLKEGFSNFDTDKIKLGFKGIGAAMSAIPILLIVEGIKYLVENFDELSKGSGFLAKALQWVGTIVTGLKDALITLADKMGLANKELMQMEANIKKYGEAVTEALSKQNTAYDQHIALLKAAGKDAAWLEKAKQDNIIRTNKLLVEQMISFVRSGGVLSDEQNKLLTASLDAIEAATNAKDVMAIAAETKHTDFLKKENEKRLADRKKYLEDVNAIEADAWFAKQLAEEAQAEKEKEDALLAEEAEIERQAALGLKQDEEMARYTETANSKAQLDLENAEKAKQLEQDKANATIEIANVTNQSLQSLSDLYFMVKSKNLQKGTAAERKAAEQQFKINKALAITSAVISGIQGVINALSAQSVIPEPFGTILKVASAVGIGIAAAANVAKIASTKFDAGGGGGGGSASAVTSVPIPAPPTINTPAANTNQGTTFDESGKKIGGEDKKQPVIQVKATVVETEVTDTQKRVDTLNKQSTF